MTVDNFERNEKWLATNLFVCIEHSNGIREKPAESSTPLALFIGPSLEKPRINEVVEPGFLSLRKRYCRGQTRMYQPIASRKRQTT